MSALGARAGDERGVIVYGATDLALASEYEFAVLRRLDHKLGRTVLTTTQDAMLKRAPQLGDAHEGALLQRYRDALGPWDPATGRGVKEIARLELVTLRWAPQLSPR